MERPTPAFRRECRHTTRRSTTIQRSRHSRFSFPSSSAESATLTPAAHVTPALSKKNPLPCIIQPFSFRFRARSLHLNPRDLTLVGTTSGLTRRIGAGAPASERSRLDAQLSRTRERPRVRRARLPARSRAMSCAHRRSHAPIWIAQRLQGGAQLAHRATFRIAHRSEHRRCSRFSPASVLVRCLPARLAHIVGSASHGRLQSSSLPNGWR